jgi:hypothetical protein
MTAPLCSQKDDGSTLRAPVSVSDRTVFPGIIKILRCLFGTSDGRKVVTAVRRLASQAGSSPSCSRLYVRLPSPPSLVPVRGTPTLHRGADEHSSGSLGPGNLVAKRHPRTVRGRPAPIVDSGIAGWGLFRAGVEPGGAGDGGRAWRPHPGERVDSGADWRSRSGRSGPTSASGSLGQ